MNSASTAVAPAGPSGLDVSGPMSSLVDRYLAIKPADSAPGERREWLDYRDSTARGTMLPSGADATVLRHPDRPGEFRRDSIPNRERFLNGWCAWSAEGAEAVARSTWDALPAEMRTWLEWARLDRERCLGAIDENLQQAVGTPFPYVRLPWLMNFAPFKWEPKTRRVRLATDLTTNVLAGWEAARRPPASEPWPGAIQRFLRDRNEVRVYEVVGLGGLVYVVVAYLCPLSFRIDLRSGQPLVELDGGVLDLFETVRKTFETWRKRDGRPAQFVHYSFGIAGRNPTLPTAGHGRLAGDHREIFWTTDLEGRVLAAVPDRLSDRLSWRDFGDRLLPITAQERLSRIKSEIDHLRENGEPGSITVERVAKRMPLRQRTNGGEQAGYRKSLVLDGFLKLQEREPETYAVEKGKARDSLSRGGPKVGQVRVVLPRDAEVARVTRSSLRGEALREHGLGIFALAVTGGAALAVNRWKEELGLTGWQSYLLWIPIAYAGKLFTNWMNRKANRSNGSSPEGGD